MHLFFRTIGFSGFDINQEEKLLKNCIKESLDNGKIIYNKDLKRGIIICKTSEHTGLYIYGQYDGRRFKQQYYHPFLYGSKISEGEEVTIERHIDKESFAVMSEDVRAGVTLIFYLINVDEYLSQAVKGNRINKNNSRFSFVSVNNSENKLMVGKQIILSGLSIGGRILLPITKNENQIKKIMDASDNRKSLLAAAKKGDEEAIESLTLEDLNIYTKLSKRILHQDVFSIVETSFMPSGVECDQYSIVGEILSVECERNDLTREEMYVMSVDCNDMIFDIVINKFDLIGEPAVGRRFKGRIWLQGMINFIENEAY